MNKLIVVTSNIAPYRLRWCEELAKHFDVTIVYTKGKDFERDDRWVKTKSNVCKLIKLKNNSKYDPLCFDVIDVIKNNRDALFIFDGYGPKTNILGLIYCKVQGIKPFVNIDGFSTERKVSRIKELIKKYIITELCPHIFCGGDNVKEYILRYGVNDESVIVHNLSSISIDEILEKPLTIKEKLNIRKELGIECKGNIVLGVGRFIPLKRFEDLIKAVKLCKNECDLYLLGGKPTKEYLDLVGNNTNIHFIDFVLPEDVYKYYMASNLFVLPSETDVWGLVINEAMSKGLPIVSSDSPIAAKNLVKDNGKIYKTYDINQLANCIDYCLELKNNETMSKNSLEIIKDYTIENMVNLQLPAINDYFNKRK